MRKVEVYLLIFLMIVVDILLTPFRLIIGAVKWVANLFKRRGPKVMLDFDTLDFHNVSVFKGKRGGFGCLVHIKCHENDAVSDCRVFPGKECGGYHTFNIFDDAVSNGWYRKFIKVIPFTYPDVSLAEKYEIDDSFSDLIALLKQYINKVGINNIPQIVN